MSSAYQQVPLGIPVSQNPYPSLPCSQNFPDEADPESSQLQPSLNNPLPPVQQQFYGYGQQPLPMNQPGQFYGVPPQGYSQQPQYIMVPVDPERRALDMKISAIDIRIDNGWYFAYKVCLWINIAGSILGLFQLSFCLILFSIIEDFKGTAAVGVTVVILLFITWYIWILQHSLVFKNAMNDKNLEGARRGMRSMIGFAIYFLVTFIGGLVAIEYAKSTLPRDMQRESWVPYYMQAFIYMYALPTSLKLFGAKKTIDLLAEREVLLKRCRLDLESIWHEQESKKKKILCMSGY